MAIKEENSSCSVSKAVQVSSSLEILTPNCTLSRSTPAPLQPGTSKPEHSLMTNHRTERDKAPCCTASVSTCRRGSISASSACTKRDTEKRVSVAFTAKSLCDRSDTVNVSTKGHTKSPSGDFRYRE
ncbi:hypothetical protein ElyMa_005859000 [Elysia marginata]|uniref:Uncharacterized protein n=1 Tax=Elysia marginata TaxID=1093978 RepID=A0AAV4G0H2_9GAST|nr:hypothetical protein ElyMa_005859000 [Elysia marginata]